MTTKNAELRAYNGDKKFKAAFVKEMTLHYKADDFVKGAYWQNGKGCAVGCSIDSLNKISGKRHEHSNHAASETIGIPESLYRLQDSIFEGLTNGEAKKFPLKFSKAITPGADLSKVTAQFLVWCLLDKKHGAIRNAPADKFADCHNAILAAAAVWQSYLKTGKVDESAAARSAESAAWSAESAAWSAESAARSAWSAARSAWSAESAAWSAESAAWSAESAARSAARSARSAAKNDFWKSASVTLIKLLKKAK